MATHNVNVKEFMEDFIPVRADLFLFEVDGEDWLKNRIFGVKVGTERVKISIYQSENEKEAFMNWLEKIQIFGAKVNATHKVFNRVGEIVREIPLNLSYDDYDEEWNWDAKNVPVAVTHVYFYRV